MLEKLPAAVGEALADVRAGLTSTLLHAVDLRQGMGRLVLSSSAFVDHAPLPERCTADGEGVSPPLAWAGAPAGTTEVVLVVEDADSPTPQPLVHLIVHGLPPEGELAEGTGDVDRDGGGHGVAMGLNSLLQARWLAPDPPPGHGVHRYVFQVFALAEGAPLPDHPGRDALRQALVERALASGSLIGTYERPSGRIPEGTAPAVAA